MPTNSLQKLINIGHEITLHIADPNVPVNTAWSGYVTPSVGYSSPPNPYREPDNSPTTTTDNIRKSTGFDGVELGTSTQFIRVPLDASTENASTVFSGGGFVLDAATGLTSGFIVNKSANTVDVDVTAMVKWYIQNFGANQSSRMKILGKGSYKKPISPDIETPYGYISDFAPPGSGTRASESYMITQPTGAVDDTSEVVTAAGRRATVEFYSFGETADQFNAFTGQYGFGTINTQINYSKANGSVTLIVDPSLGNGTITLQKSDQAAMTFWTRLKPNINTTDIFTASMTITTADGIPPANTTGTVTDVTWAENTTSIVISFQNYSQSASFFGEVDTLNNLTFSIIRTGRSFFNLGSFGNPIAVTADAIFTNHYPSVNEGSFIYFPQGLTLTANNAALTINGTSGKKRFKIVRSLPSPATGRHFLEVEPWSNFTSRNASNSNAITISTGLYRPKMIVSYNSA